MWIKVLRENYPKDMKVLGTDTKGNILLGILMEGEDSSTGFIVHNEEDDSEIECAAFQFIESIHWNDCKLLPNDDDKVVFLDITEQAHIGNIYQVADGIFVGEDENGTYDVSGWYVPNSYQAENTSMKAFHKQKYWKILPLAAMLFIGILINEALGISFKLHNIDRYGLPPATEQTYNAMMYELENYQANREKTQKLIHTDEWIKDSNIVSFTLDKKYYEEPFDRDEFYVDDFGNWHYTLETGQSAIMTDDGLYLSNKLHNHFTFFENWSILFLHDYASANAAEDFTQQHVFSDYTCVNYFPSYNRTKELHHEITTLFGNDIDNAIIRISISGQNYYEKLDLSRLSYDFAGNLHYKTITQDFSSETDGMLFEIESMEHYKLLFCSYLT